MNDDATITQFDLDPTSAPTANWRRFDAMTEQERHAAALADPDCPPATEDQLASARRAPDIKAIRHALGLTQEEFARTFDLALGTVRDWEQGSHPPDSAARALLRVIAFSPETVRVAVHQR